MRSNGRPALRASALSVEEILVHPRERVMVACRECGAWRTLKRSMVTPHREVSGRGWCSGSGQKVLVDLAVGVWQARRTEAIRQAAQRAPSDDRLSTPGPPPVAPAVHQLAAAR